MTKFTFDCVGTMENRSITIDAYSLDDALRQFDIHYVERWHWYRIYVGSRCLVCRD